MNAESVNNQVVDQKRKNMEAAREAQEKAVVYRTEKRWKIFSWASSMLIGSIAGAVAVNKVDLPCEARILLCVAVIALTSYTVLWLDFNRRSLFSALANLQAIENKLGIYESIDINIVSQPFWLKIVSYGVTVSLLAIIAILMILIPCL